MILHETSDVVDQDRFDPVTLKPSTRPVDQDRFDPITLKPSTGLAVIFSQNIIHESVMIQSSVKCILKTDIILKRIQPLGFQVSDVERRFFKMFEFVSNCAIARIKERFM